MSSLRDTCEYWAGERPLLKACHVKNETFPAHCTKGRTECYDGVRTCKKYKRRRWYERKDKDNKT